MNPLERMRLDKRWSRADLAERAGVNHKTIKAIEEGAEPGASVAGKIADAFQMKPSEFVALLRGVPAAPESEVVV